MIALVNSKIQSLAVNGKNIEIGKKLSNYFSDEVEEKVEHVFTSNAHDTLNGYQISGATYNMDVIPLSGQFQGQGVILTLNPVKASAKE